MNRPKITISKEPFDVVIEMTGWLFLILLVIYPFFYFGSLPTSIPIHFGPDGQPDDYGNKIFIFLLPAIGLGLYLLLISVNRYPHTFNYPKKITPENAAYQYRVATQMIRLLNTVIIIGFAYINYAIVQHALGHTGGLGKLFMPLFLLAVFGVIGYGLYAALKKQEKTE